MKNTLFIAFFYLFFLPIVNAEIVSATGHAPIINNNIPDARNAAVKDAIRQALLQTGANISSEQEISNGAITRDQFKIKSSSNIKSYSIVSQENNGTYLSVTIKADIRSNSKSCSSNNFAKSISTIRFSYDENQRFYSERGLIDIHKELTRQFYSRLLQDNKYFDVKPWLDFNYNIDLRSISNNYQSNKLKQQIKQLTTKMDSQYLMLGSIRDITFSDPDGNMITKYFNNPNRNISFSIYIIDGYTGDLIFAKNYSGKAVWQFGEKEHVDVKSNNFWQSEYGKKINELISIANADIIRELQCKPLYARVTRVINDDIYINAGLQNNIYEGTTFTIMMPNNYVDQNKTQRTVNKKLPGTYVVKESYPDGAMLNILKGKRDTNIQPGDIAIVN